MFCTGWMSGRLAGVVGDITYNEFFIEGGCCRLLVQYARFLNLLIPLREVKDELRHGITSHVAEKRYRMWTIHAQNGDLNSLLRCLEHRSGAYFHKPLTLETVLFNGQMNFFLR